MSHKRFHVSGDTYRSSTTGLLCPKLLTEGEAHALIDALAARTERPEQLKMQLDALEVGQSIAGRNFGLLIRMRDSFFPG